MCSKTIEKDIFSFDIVYSFLCSNKNRVAILYLLGKKEEMKAEEIANKIGISHRTALYHLDILEGCKLVEVKKYRKKGGKNMRSVWGISRENRAVVDDLFTKFDKFFSKDELEGIINTNIARR